MAKNFVQPGEVVTLTAPGTTASGDLVIVGACVGVAAADAASGTSVEVALTGVFTLPKTAPLVIAEGAAVSWDNSTKKVLAPASGKYPLGVCVKAAGSADTTVVVRLNGVATVAP